jgi:hypothetical protein
MGGCNFMQKRFSVVMGSKKYGENYDNIFRKKKGAKGGADNKKSREAKDNN